MSDPVLPVLKAMFAAGYEAAERIAGKTPLRVEDADPERLGKETDE